VTAPVFRARPRPCALAPRCGTTTGRRTRGVNSVIRWNPATSAPVESAAVGADPAAGIRLDDHPAV